ncbi:hypothetical protein [Arthrobacter castelli]|uniref:hypothetical protein n=1 Tax=Arthrobacter castelli TaxID=271431 RepID=UPI00040AE778|nr:hypothetical protein [Arthrobacter castelli]
MLNRLIEVGTGVAVGVAVNMLLAPPLRDRQTSRYIDSINRRMGGVLASMADEFSTALEYRSGRSLVQRDRTHEPGVGFSLAIGAFRP